MKRHPDSLLDLVVAPLLLGCALGLVVSCGKPPTPPPPPPPPPPSMTFQVLGHPVVIEEGEIFANADFSVETAKAQYEAVIIYLENQ